MPHYEVMEMLQKGLNLKRGDTWGNYSHDTISRHESLFEAARNAFAVVLAPEKSLYKRKN